MNYLDLKSAIIGLVGSDEEVAAQLNVVDIPAVKNISVASIKQYLIVTGKILAIRASAVPAALLTVEALDAFEEFVMSDVTNSTALNNQLDGLIAEGLLTTNDKNYLLSLGDTLTSLAEQSGLGLVRAGDVTYARGL